MNRYENLGNLLQDYLWNNYIQNNARFPPQDWNVHNWDVDQRTNNNVESVFFLCLLWTFFHPADPGLSNLEALLTCGEREGGREGEKN